MVRSSLLIRSTVRRELRHRRRDQSFAAASRLEAGPFASWLRPMCLQPDGTHTEWELSGGVREAFDDTTSPEILLAGSAGSGKTIGALLKLYWTCRNFPNARCLLLRKTRVSLTESSLVTWERDILGGPDHPMLKANPNLRDTRKAY